MNNERLLERFLRYVRVDTKADELSKSSPSSLGQRTLSEMLFEECRQMGLSKVEISPEGVVLAEIPATVSYESPVIAWFAHVDTSPEYSATNVEPIVHRNYQGEDLTLPGDRTKVLRVSEHPALKENVGHTVITTDGTTLLGADDKSGITAIMTAAEFLLSHPEIEHGPIQLCFTLDEEIGRGTEALDLSKIRAVCGYTLDSEGVARIDAETFSADLAIVKVEGVNTHPSIGKGVMVNAIKILGEYLTHLPSEHSPETTEGREGFLHPYQVSGGVAEASCRIILRDFETSKLSEYAELLETLAQQMMSKYARVKVSVEIHKQYRNMREGLKGEPRAISKAVEAVRRVGLSPLMNIIRGGTDGALLTELGLPTPNLSSGQHNPHSPLEWTSVEEMVTAAKILVELAKLWGQETA